MTLSHTLLPTYIEKTLVDLLGLLIEKGRARTFDFTIDLAIAGTKIGSLRVAGKTEYLPAEKAR